MAIPQPGIRDIEGLMNLLKTGKYAELEAKSRDFCKQYPKVLGFYDLLSKAQIAQQDLKGAVRTLKKAVKLKPEFIDGQYNLGVAYLNLGKVKEAKAQFELVVAKKPDHLESKHNLAACHLREENEDAAIALYRECLKINPDFIPALMTIGARLRNRGDIEESEQHLQHLVGLRSDFAVGHYSLGKTKSVLGKNDEAKQCFEKALELQPEMKDAKEALEKLQA